MAEAPAIKSDIEKQIQECLNLHEKERVDELLSMQMEPYYIARDNKQDSVVYFVFSRDHQLIKIGFTTDIEKRLSGLRCHSPASLDLLGTVPAHRAVEKALHHYLSRFMDHGEWFKAKTEVMAVAEVAIKGGMKALCIYLEKMMRFEIEKSLRLSRKMDKV